jgi:hypothetical protein
VRLMDQELEKFFHAANHTRYRPNQKAGHYESFFQRANHPNRPLAFWIRYTIFSPDKRPDDALGELWAIYFDGETGRHVAVKNEVPFKDCLFKNSEFFAQVGDARLEPGRLMGAAASAGHTIEWDLHFSGDDPPLLLLPLALYKSKLPKAKGLVGLPMASYRGALLVDGTPVEVADWVGSQNHNWGVQHTDHYAWGQVAGFDTHPSSFLEVITARMKVGPMWTPFITNMVLRHAGEDIALNGLKQALRAKGTFDYFQWHFTSESDDARIEGTISAAKDAFVGLNYYNPPGGTKHCLNSKIAACELRLTRKRPGEPAVGEGLSTKHRAGFEILTDDRGHGVEIRA